MLVLFVLLLYVPVNSYGHYGTVSSPNHIFFSWASLNQYFMDILSLVTDNEPFLNDSAEGSRVNVEFISWSISSKVWDRAGIELATPWSADNVGSSQSTNVLTVGV